MLFPCLVRGSGMYLIQASGFASCHHHQFTSTRLPKSPTCSTCMALGLSCLSRCARRGLGYASFISLIFSHAWRLKWCVAGSNNTNLPKEASSRSLAWLEQAKQEVQINKVFRSSVAFPAEGVDQLVTSMKILHRACEDAVIILLRHLTSVTEYRDFIFQVLVSVEE